MKFSVIKKINLFGFKQIEKLKYWSFQKIELQEYFLLKATVWEELYQKVLKSINIFIIGIMTSWVRNIKINP